jgi:hypothetical protein
MMYFGDVQLSYRVTDGQDATTGSIKLTVDPVNDVTTLALVFAPCES